MGLLYLYVLIREESNRAPWTPPAVKGFVCFTDGSRTAEETGAGFCGQSADRRHSISLGKHSTIFQTELYAMLASVHETVTQDRPKKYVRNCFVSQAALKSLHAAKTASPFL